MGSPGKIYVRIYNQEYPQPCFHDKSLYPLLINYLEKNKYLSKNKNIDIFKEVKVGDFISKIAESSKYI